MSRVKVDDSERIREQIEDLGASPVIPWKSNSIKGNADLDKGCIAIGIWSKVPLRG